jgi:branched-chain amino acid transport system ATP-binding protein
MTALLQVRGIEAGYGPAPAIKDVSFSVNAGQVTALLGANGAGKSTTMLTLSGLLKLRAGEVLIGGRSIANMSNDDIVRLGLVQVPQGRQIFPAMTVTENIELGAFVRRREGIDADLDRVLAYFPRLAERRRQLAGTLSGGEQQMLAIGRALMAKPRVLLLDEPSLGLAPVIVDSVYEIVLSLVADGLGIVLAEQNIAMALSVASLVCILRNGAVFASGTGQEMKSSDLIGQAYLG